MKQRTTILAHNLAYIHTYLYTLDINSLLSKLRVLTVDFSFEAGHKQRPLK